MNNVFDNAKKQLEKAYKYIEIEEETKKILETPKEINKVDVKIEMDDGKKSKIS